jgi:hypothetical protein
MLIKIISGGQTGVDRAALDVAIATGLSHGGWCPQGRRAEDGVIPLQYELQETQSSGFRQRTKQNVVDSDATLILSSGELMGGSLTTQEFAKKLARPYLVYDLDTYEEQGAMAIVEWLRRHSVDVLNVAGTARRTLPWNLLRCLHGLSKCHYAKSEAN